MKIPEVIERLSDIAAAERSADPADYADPMELHYVRQRADVMDEAVRLLTMLHSGSVAADEEYHRVTGTMECVDCGRELWRHPRVRGFAESGEEVGFLVLCDGTLGKT